MKGKKKVLWGTLTALCILLCSSMTVFAAEEAAEYVPKKYASFWALVPPVCCQIRTGVESRKKYIVLYL
ncbi:MAG: hypothetical protein ACLTST_07940 [Lachnospiraceae bacterium]